MNFLVKTLLWIYQLPQHLLGLILLLFLKALGIVEKNLKWKEATLYKVYSGPFHWGVSLGFFIFLTDFFIGDTTTIKHEYGHTRQSMILGPLYLIVVGIPSFIRATIWFVFNLKSADYYKGYPENWADRLGKVVRRK